MTVLAGSQTVTLMIRFCFPPTTVSPAKMTTGFVLRHRLDRRDRPVTLLAQLEVAGRPAAVAVSYDGSRATPHSSAPMTSPSREIVTSGLTVPSASLTCSRTRVSSVIRSPRG